MQRLHVSLAVAELQPSITFYSQLFGVPPTFVRPDYAKWSLDDPRMNFSVATTSSSGVTGVDHLGIQVDSEAEFGVLMEQVVAMETAASQIQEGECCYARSTKSWVKDPDGVAWEAFITHEQIDSEASAPQTRTCC